MRWLIGFLLLAGLSTLSGVSWQLYSFEGDDPTKLGQRGDFFGGFLNPILTFLGFIGVLITVSLQRNSYLSQTKDSKEQRAATHRQSFESTLFQMLTLHNTIVEKVNVSVRRPERNNAFSTVSINPKMITEKFEGRDAFEHFGNEFHNSILKSLTSADENETNPMDEFEKEYARFWKKRRQDLGHYFRFLYNIVRFIDESDFSKDKNYIRFVRAQLSDYELLMLFYNSLSVQGKNFKPLIEKYSLLNNIPSDFEIPEKLLGNIDKQAFGN